MNTTSAGAGFCAADDQPHTRQLHRSDEDTMLAGVAGGLARYLDADVTLVRVAIAALTLFTGGAAAAVYLAAWMLVPADGQDESLAQAWIAARPHPSR